MDMQADGPVDAVEDLGPSTSPSAPERTPSIEDDFEELFGERTMAPSASTRDYAAEVAEVVSGWTNGLASQLAPHLPEDVARIAQEHALAVLAAAVLFLLLLLYGAVRTRRAGPPRRALLLTGPMGAGKTTLFYALQGVSPPHGTVTSMDANTAVCRPPGAKRAVQVVDVPGHPRKRSVFEEHAAGAAGVVFVLDAADFVRQKADIAGQLYDTLVTLAPAGRRVSVLLACNKADAGSRAFSTDFILKQLAKEIGALRQTRRAQLGRDGAAGADGLARPGQPFTFEACPFRVSACSISAAQRDLSPLADFVARAL